jgi:hypothetical protein
MPLKKAWTTLGVPKVRSMTPPSTSAGPLASLQTSASNKHHHIRSETDAEMSRRVSKQRQGTPTRGSAEHGKRTDERIIAHAGFGPKCVV